MLPKQLDYKEIPDYFVLYKEDRQSLLQVI